MTERLTDGEVQALAGAFANSLSARQVLEAAGLAVARQPNWGDTTSLRFWREVNSLLGNGILPEGRRQVLAAAAAEFPANPVFAQPDLDGASEVPAPGGPDRPRHPDAEVWDGSPTFPVSITDSIGVMVGSGNVQTLNFGPM
ncbi:effector-associated domain EAD1-containing protein, partial [Frankia sp. CpI1-P]